MSTRASSAQLDEIGPLAVTEAVSSFRIDRYRSASGAERTYCVLQGFRRCDDGRHALDGRGEQLRFLIKIRFGKRYFGQFLREFRLGGLRREGIITTPAGSGGRPASVQSSSAQPAR